MGQNLLGKRTYDRLVSEIGIDDQLIFVAASGRYSFKGVTWVRSGRFERVQLVQEEKTIPLTARGYKNIDRLAIEGAPEFREIGVFVLPAESGFDALRPWRLDLLVDRGEAGAAAIFPIDYRLPDRYVLSPPVQAAGETVGEDAKLEDVPFWEQAWRDRRWSIGGVLLLLGTLTTILVLQDRISSNKRLHRRLRLAFLAVTLVWLGWIVGGQLSVVNVLTFAHALMSEFRWEFFLVDPVLFLLWSYVGVALLFWGRGVFCGWLCPFGALQELLNEGARQLRIPQAAPAVYSAREAVAAEVRHFPRPVRGLAELGQPRLYRRRSGAVQDGDLDEVRAALAIRGLCGGVARRRLVRRAIFLPLSLPARRGARNSGAPAHVRMAEATPAVRPRVRHLRT